MKSIAVAEAENRLSSLVDEVRASGEVIEIREQNQPAVYLVEAGTFRRLRGIEDSVRSDQLREALKEERYPLEEVLSSLDL